MTIMTPKELSVLAHEMISEKLDRREPITRPWVTQELISRQGFISGEGVAFYHLCAREHVYRVVKRIIDKYDSNDPSEDTQGTLPGFRYVRKGYSVMRGGEITIVHCDDCTDEELLARADLLCKQSATCLAHARELRDLVAQRRGLRVC